MAVATFSKPLILPILPINICPTLEDKRDIVQNSIDLTHMRSKKTNKFRVAVL